MNSDRLSQLQRFAEEDPQDAFNWYALALEYQKSDPEKALNLFNKLLFEFDEYLPAYYMAANHHAYLGNMETALDIFRRGIRLAEKQQDLKTAGELRSELDELLFE